MPTRVEFEGDIRRLLEAKVTGNSFRAICRTAPSSVDLETAVGIIYDHFNFVDGDPRIHEYLEIAEEETARRKEDEIREAEFEKLKSNNSKKKYLIDKKGKKIQTNIQAIGRFISNDNKNKKRSDILRLFMK